MRNIKAKLMGFVTMAIVCVNNGNAATMMVLDAEVKSITLATNESIMFVGGYAHVPYYSINGVTNLAYDFSANGPHEIIGSSLTPDIVTGPITLYFTYSLFGYRIITNSPFKTVARQCGDSAVINVETNKTIRFISSWGRTDSMLTFFTNFDSSANITFSATYGMELDGPVYFNFYDNYNAYGDYLVGCTNYSGYTNCFQRYINGLYSINNQQCTNPQPLYYEGHLVNYYIIDEFISTPANGYVENSPGSLMLTVEKSTTLTNWFPAFITSVGDDQYTFYRLKLSRKSDGGGSFIMNGFNGYTESSYENERPPIQLPPTPWHN